MESAKNSPLRMRFDLKISLLRLERQLTEAEAALRQAKFDLREAKVAQAEYSGSFRSFRDTLTGKKETAETDLRHTVQKAEAALASAQQELDRIGKALPGLREQLAQLPAWVDLKDGSREWNQLEAQYCAEALAPLLEETHRNLLERRKMTTGANPGKVYSFSEQAEIGCAPEESAARCSEWIARLARALEALDFPVPDYSFFRNPSHFLNSATQYTRLNQLNEAIAQTETMQRLLPGLRKQLKE